MKTETAVLAFSALSQETRLLVLRQLVVAGTSGLTPGVLSEQMSIPPSTLSFHLKELEQAGLVQGQRDGRQIHYVADYGGLRGLINYLLSDCCQGDPRLCGPYVVQSKQ